MFCDSDIRKVLEASKIEDVIGEFIDLKKDGSRYKCCCPIHNEKTPSFTVTPSRNMFYCFGCGVGGNAISFLTKVRGMSFPEAVKHLADKYRIDIKENREPLTAEESAMTERRQAMLTANQAAQQFFEEQIKKTDGRSSFAKKYAEDRWGKNYVEQEGIGFAPGRGAFLSWAEGKGLPTEILLELGLLRKSDDGRIYDGIYDRITIPIRSHTNQIIGFTARVLTDAKPKYINSPESLVFHKSDVIFGLNSAARQGAKEELFYLVEGAPDVMRLQSLNVCNAIASLGTAWNEKQFQALRRYNPTLCFIPDIDPPKNGEEFGAGIASVIKNGLTAHKAGFRVIVKEITPNNSGEKADPDSFIKNRDILDEIPKVDFVPWYAQKLLANKQTTGERAEVMKTVARLLATVQDKDFRDLLIRQCAKILKVPINAFISRVNETVKENVNSKQASGEKMINQELYQKYGFNERNHCYFSLDKNGNEEEWSNFSLEPLFHIKDQLNPKRLFRIVNVNGQEEIIELKQADLVSLQQFKLRVEGFGNFIWKAKEEQLTKLKGFLYEKTETAVEITQLGWQPAGFFAFGNGVVFDNGQWMPTDGFGIVRMPETGNFYLPSASKIYKNERKLFQFERKFVHLGLNGVSLRQYSDKMIEVFGDNAKIGLCFLFATLFKDIVTAKTKNFPILNLFGPKGSGKSEMGHSLMSFFIINNEPPNISSATDAGLADAIAQCSNALVHLDEYKNSIELSRREFIKGLYDGVGRTRMNMDRDKKRETTAVDCGVIMSGQEMPTIDIAIYSRLIFLTFNTSRFSIDAKRRFDELKQMRDHGCSHLAIELLRHRKKVEADFSSNYRTALDDVIEAIGNESVEDRILRNWVIPLAIFRTLSGVVDVAFDYRDMLKICLEGIVRQNKECRANNELAAFWEVVDFLHQDGQIYFDGDYRIRYENSFKCKGMTEKAVFLKAKPILYLSLKRIMNLYQKNGKITGTQTIPQSTLRFYLEKSNEFLGIKNAVRFKIYSNNLEAVKVVPGVAGTSSAQPTSRTDWALCFDYDKLVENYGINLEIDTVQDNQL